MGVYARFLTRVDESIAELEQVEKDQQAVLAGCKNPSFARCESELELECIESFLADLRGCKSDNLLDTKTLADAASDRLQDVDPQYFHSVYAKGLE